jgi:AcrR family transcriptional regulator
MTLPNAAPVPRHCDTETAILEAARDLLAEGGLEALSMRAVAARIGVSATAIYHWFENKEALVDRVVSHGFDRSEAYLWTAIESLPKGSVERLAALGEAYIRFAIENEQYFKVIFAIQPPAPRHIDDVPGHGGYRVLRQCVVDAMEAGNIRRTDPDLVVLFLWSVVHGLVTIFMACDPKDMLAECEACNSAVEHLSISIFLHFQELIREGLTPREAREAGSAERETTAPPGRDGPGVTGNAQPRGSSC